MPYISPYKTAIRRIGAIVPTRTIGTTAPTRPIGPSSPAPTPAPATPPAVLPTSAGDAGPTLPPTTVLPPEAVVPTAWAPVDTSPIIPQTSAATGGVPGWLWLGAAGLGAFLLLRRRR